MLYITLLNNICVTCFLSTKNFMPCEPECPFKEQLDICWTDWLIYTYSYKIREVLPLRPRICLWQIPVSHSKYRVNNEYQQLTSLFTNNIAMLSSSTQISVHCYIYKP